MQSRLDGQLGAGSTIELGKTRGWVTVHVKVYSAMHSANSLRPFGAQSEEADEDEEM